MTTYRIRNTISGQGLGSYDGNLPIDALDAMARDAGYKDMSDAEHAAPLRPGELRLESDDHEDGEGTSCYYPAA